MNSCDSAKLNGLTLSVLATGLLSHIAMPAVLPKMAAATADDAEERAAAGVLEMMVREEVDCLRELCNCHEDSSNAPPPTDRVAVRFII